MSLRPRRVASASGDVRLTSRAVRAAQSHIVSAVNSHMPIPGSERERLFAIHRRLSGELFRLHEIAVDLELSELRHKRERRRTTKRKAA